MNNKMKIDFLVGNPDMEIGSYRIWVHDFVQTLTDLGIDVQVPTNIHLVRDGAVLVFSKGDAHLSKHEFFKDYVKGAINISPTKDEILPLDFVIAGSPEEKLSLLPYYNSVVIINLIEKLYENVPPKIHKFSDTLTIGYHGSFSHVCKLGDWDIVDAISKLGQHTNIHLKFISNDPELVDKLVTPVKSVCQVSSKRWDFERIKDEIQSFDVCIIPNSTDITRGEEGGMSKTANPVAGLYDTDYCLRYKNKSNSGRAFVAYQLGIPVIADLTPSNMPMLFDEKCGYLASNFASFYRALYQLLDPDKRNNIASNAHKRFNSIYSSTRDAEDFIKMLQSLGKKNETAD
jgi:glycosyltransferase involved in cell wall biosynthesis